jgi:hypothetical protein
MLMSKGRHEEKKQLQELITAEHREMKRIGVKGKMEDGML